MMNKSWALCAVLAGLLAACATPEPAPPAPAPPPAWVAQASAVAAAVPPNLLAVLQAEIARGGAENAVEACRVTAPQMARTASQQSGWSIRRVSLRNRNPKAVPDAWERAALEDFDRRAAARESPATLQRAETVQENGQSVQRYIRALPTMELCTQCHGTADQLKPAVVERLKALYPDDRATGYRVGELRGAITLRRPVPQ
jgi:hypothetical protein